MHVNEILDKQGIVCVRECNFHSLSQRRVGTIVLSTAAVHKSAWYGMTSRHNRHSRAIFSLPDEVLELDSMKFDGPMLRGNMKWGT